MNISRRLHHIAKSLTTAFSSLSHRGCRKVDQVLDAQTGKLYELFKNEEGFLTVWETDADGVTTFWDCGDRWRVKQDIDFANLNFVCDI